MMSSDDEVFLHFTLGPVQGFVAQARRTRDLWAGSFLLSYLSGIAMAEVLKAGGEIVFPAVEEGNSLTDPLLRKIAELSDHPLLRKKADVRGIAGFSGDTGPSAGTLPNRFKARIPPTFDPGACVQAVQAHWQKMAEVVWQKFMAPCAGVLPEINTSSRVIWRRQVESFWDMAWVLGTEDDLLDRRKNWRTHIPSIEPGSKCTIMGGLQELSGYTRALRRERDLQDKFWAVIRGQKHLPDLDLDENERLCAIALVKRLFPHVAQECVGWSVPRHFPSTSSVAALSWIARRLEADAAGCIVYAETLAFAKHPEERIAQSKRVAQVLEKVAGAELGQAADKAGWADKLRRFAQLEGTCFFKEDLRNEHLWSSGTKSMRDLACKRLEGWAEKPSAFYALLLMDGDRLGALLQERESRGGPVSKALACFARRVEEKVSEYNGFLIYAGGDDLLAMFPVEEALNSAGALREEYRQAFQKVFDKDAVGTISAAIIFAQHTVPLRDVLVRAHHALDKIAKEECGRDSLAVQIMRPSGTGFSWAAPWNYILDSAYQAYGPENSQKLESPTALGNRLESLVKMFEVQQGGRSELNASFLHNLRERYELLGGGPEGTEESFWLDIFTAEFVKNRQREVSRDQTEKLTRALFEVCRRVRRVAKPTNDGQALAEMELSTSWTLDGALLARFLIQRGVED